MKQKNILNSLFLIAVFFMTACGQQSPEHIEGKEAIKTKVAGEVVKAKVKEEIVIENKIPEEKKSNVDPIQKESTFSDGTTATITGTIRYDGEVPKFREIKMDADPICVMHHKESVFPQTLVLGDPEMKTMANVFVHVVKGLPDKKYKTPTEEVVLTQAGCMYDPHVIGVMVNQQIKILNPDGTLHNVHATPKINAEFNLAMPKFRKEMIRSFDKVEFMFPVKCDVHPWMGAWITVLDHPYFSVTKPDGVYTIANLDPGTYELEAWHEKLGMQKISVTLAAGEIKNLDLIFSK